MVWYNINTRLLFPVIAKHVKTERSVIILQNDVNGVMTWDTSL